VQELFNILKKVRPDVDFGSERALIDDGVLNSFDVINIVTDINITFSTNIGVDDLTPTNFNSADSMMKLIESSLDREGDTA
jgi:acyl carrier protein